MWVKSKEPFEYTRWAPNEPNHSRRPGNDENCLDLLPHKAFMWNDESCETPMNFLCETVYVLHLYSIKVGTQPLSHRFFVAFFCNDFACYECKVIIGDFKVLNVEMGNI